jgi:hypothetical protein
MGQMKRSAERERILRSMAHPIVIKWKTDGPNWLVNFLDPRSRLPLTRQRVYSSPEPIQGLVARSLTILGGPKKTIFEQNLLSGRGEIEVEISGEQYVKLKGS